MAKKRKKTTAEMKKIKNMVMERLADPGKYKSEIAQEIGRRPPYMYTELVLIQTTDHDTGGMNGGN